MDHFTHKDGVLHAEDVPLTDIAKAVGTPCYVYSRATLERHARVFREALKDVGPHHIAFAIKANPNLAVLRVLANMGYGADVVSGGEVARALAAGVAPVDIIFSGVGKSAREITAALEAGIGQFNIESEEEGRELAALASELGLTAQAVLRVNPDVDARTHAKISTGKAENKFGVAISDAAGIFSRLAGLPGLNLRGLATHIGSMIADLGPMEEAFGKIGALVGELREEGHAISHVDLGGGVGVPYRPGDVYPSPAEYGAMVRRVSHNWGVTLMFEPGRLIAANAGVLLTEVIRVKPGSERPFVIVDAAMNDLARPALYDAYHHFEAVTPTGAMMDGNIAGPVCETGDTFAMARSFDEVKAGDLGIFRSAGAYGATMASTYNSRDLIPEVLVDGDKFAVVAERIPAATVMAAEKLPDWL